MNDPHDTLPRATAVIEQGMRDRRRPQTGMT